MVVDTAKIILNSMPNHARLVVSGIGGEYQESMVEMMDAIHSNNTTNMTTMKNNRRCIVLFPTEDARTFDELWMEEEEMKQNEYQTRRQSSSEVEEEEDKGTTKSEEDEVLLFDVIIIDGTWAQARKMHSKYIPSERDGGPPRVCLSQNALDILVGGSGSGSGSGSSTTTIQTMDDGGENNIKNDGGSSSNGRQLRRHPIKWKEISTLEASRLLLRDMMMVMGSGTNNETILATANNNNNNNNDGTLCHEILPEYQRISDAAAIKQLGPHRTKSS